MKEIKVKEILRVNGELRKVTIKDIKNGHFTFYLKKLTAKEVEEVLTGAKK